MIVFYSDTYHFPLPAQHRFPIGKYRQLREALVRNAILASEDLRLPPAATAEELSLAHDEDYVHRVFAGELSDREIRRIGFPWSPELVERSCRSVGATIAACREARRRRVGVSLSGGTHHAFEDHGGGFCVFNDAVVAARVSFQEGVRKVLIVDADVHQGDGTASLVAGDSRIFAYSIHGSSNYPLHKQISDLDLALPRGTEDASYLEAFENGLEEALQRSKPELVIYLAGADPYSGDRLGHLNVSKSGLARRDGILFQRCGRRRLPVAVTLAGGYSEPIDDTVAIHEATIRVARDVLACPTARRIDRSSAGAD